MMALLNCQPHVVIASALPNESSSSLPEHPQLKLPKPSYRKLKQPRPPSILEIERAIGAGIFRDRDIDSKAEETTSWLDDILRNTVGKKEGSVEKKLRESGEWLIHQTERTSRSAGKQILMTMFVWMIPLWMCAFLIASGLLHLPFRTPFLDDLLS